MLVLCCVEIYASTKPFEPVQGNNGTDADGRSRRKRFLVFVPNGGTAKFLTGYLGPIDIPLWQNINCLRNLQFQYDLPESWTQADSFPGFEEVGSSTSEARMISEKAWRKLKPDSSRKIAYDLVESTLNREGKNGRECMLRAICEVAESPLSHNGLVGEVLQLFFTPGQHEHIDQDYRFARQAGLNRVDCEKLFSDCPMGHGILDSFSLIEEFKFENWLKF